MPDAQGKSAGFIGYKARLSRSTAGDEGPWEAIPECRDFDPAEGTIENADFTHLESPDKTREKKATFKDYAELSANCNFIDPTVDPAGAAVQAAIIADWGVNDPDYYWKIEWRRDDGTVRKTVIFPGYVSNAKPPTTNTTDPVLFTFSVQVSGAAVWS